MIYDHVDHGLYFHLSDCDEIKKAGMKRIWSGVEIENEGVFEVFGDP